MKATLLNPTKTHVTIGTRTSDLAMWQTKHIIARLQAAWPGLDCRLQPFVTQGDKTQALDKPLPAIGGKGLFTAELERALLAGEIDLAVHSLKDLPVEDAPGLTIGAITSRADVRDALVARNGWTLATLPPGAVVGTSSTRRAAQLQALRPDLTIRSIRGNVDTRMRKVLNGDYDATLLALAGLERLGLTENITERLSLAVMLPAPGQGALAVQCRADDRETLALLAALDDAAVRAAVTAERAFLHGLGGGCSAPVAAFAQVQGATEQAHLQLEALVASTDGQKIIRVTGETATVSVQAALQLGAELATQALTQGAAALVGQRAGFIETPTAAPAPSPLAGKRVVVTRTPEQSTTLLAKLNALGATPIMLPTIRVEPIADFAALDAVLRTHKRYDWLILTSANAVTILAERLCTLGLTAQDLQHLSIAAVGPATTAALHAYGLTPRFVPHRFEATEIATGLQEQFGTLHGLRILLPQAAIARQNLAEALTAQGAVVDVIPIYHTLPAALNGSALTALQQGVDVVTFTSGSTVRNFVQGLLDNKLTPALLQSATIACIGPQTAAAAHELGLPVALVADEYTIDGLVDALVAHFQKASNRQE
ncbi:MAG: hydroxymethylbilane synthase [Caldilinea sp. CFX5]|nr:hydroxymethylbilane synthase [Caldilinea sp. CFX5]